MLLISRIIRLFLWPIEEFSRVWDKKKIGDRLGRLLIDVFVLIHLAAALQTEYQSSRSNDNTQGQRLRTVVASPR